MAEQPDPWWPLTWRPPRGAQPRSPEVSWSNRNPDALVSLPRNKLYHRPLHVIQYPTFFKVYPSETDDGSVMTCDTLLELRAALLNLAYPTTEENNDGHP